MRLLVAVFVALFLQPADAISLRRQCRLQCKPTIDACVAAGQKRRRCRRDTLRLCRREGIGVCPGGVSSTTTTTLARGPCDFDSSSRRCEGTCGNGGHCSAVAAGGACECRTTACGNASAPECNGFCDAGEACIYTVTSCSCVGVP